MKLEEDEKELFKAIKFFNDRYKRHIQYHEHQINFLQQEIRELKIKLSYENHSQKRKPRQISN